MYVSNTVYLNEKVYLLDISFDVGLLKGTIYA